jgi:hypothetical protein
MSLFVEHVFSREKSNKPSLKFYMKILVPLINGMMPRTLRFDGLMTDFGGTGIGRCFRALRSVQTSMQHSCTLSLVSFNRYTFHLVPCEIRRWVIHLVLKNRATRHKYFHLEIEKFVKKSKYFQTPLVSPLTAKFKIRFVAASKV